MRPCQWNSVSSELGVALNRFVQTYLDINVASEEQLYFLVKRVLCKHG